MSAADVIVVRMHNEGGPAGRGAELLPMLRQSLDQRWQKYAAELARCRRKCSEKSVHDLRVATRRLLATIDVILAVMPGDLIRNVERTLRKRMKAFGPLRDVQVQLLRIGKLRQDHPDLTPFYTVLLLREQHLMDLITRRLQRTMTTSMDEAVAACNERLEQFVHAEPMARVASTAAIGTAAAAFARAVVLRQAIVPGDSASIHHLRLAFKKYRYTIEVMQPALPFVTENVLKNMNAYQDRMGQIQDVEVLAGSLKQFSRRTRGKSGTRLAPVRQALEEEHRVLMTAFHKAADDLYGFWNSVQATMVAPPAA